MKFTSFFQIKRGKGTSKLKEGEFGFNTSKNTLFIGTEEENVPIGPLVFIDEGEGNIKITFGKETNPGE